MLPTATTTSYSAKVHTMKYILSLACVLLSFVIAHADGAERPNVLILYADDMPSAILRYRTPSQKFRRRTSINWPSRGCVLATAILRREFARPVAMRC